MPTASSSTADELGARRRRRGPWKRRGLIVLVEVPHAISWLPLGIALIPLALVLHQYSVPLPAQSERALARYLGAQAPSARRSGQSRRQWLGVRMTEAAFWRHDLPLVLVTMVMTTLSGYITVIGVAA